MSVNSRAIQTKWLVGLAMLASAVAALFALDELYVAFLRGSHPIIWPPEASKFLAVLIVGGVGLIVSSSQLGLRLAGGSIVGRYVFALLIITRVVNGQVMRAKTAYDIMLALDVLTMLGIALAIYSLFQQSGRGHDVTKDIGADA